MQLIQIINISIYLKQVLGQMQGNNKKQSKSKNKQDVKAQTKPKLNSKLKDTQTQKSKPKSNYVQSENMKINQNNAYNEKTNYLKSKSKQNDIIMMPKNYRIELDNVEQQLKNRDTTAEQLNKIVNQHMIESIIQIYKNHSSLRQQTSRVLLQIYSHHSLRPIFHELQKYQIALITVNLLLSNYKELNEAAAVECLQGIVKQGNFNLMQIFKSQFFSQKRSQIYHKQTNQQRISDIVYYLIKKWCENVNSIFMNCFFTQVYNLLNNLYQKSNSLDDLSNSVINKQRSQVMKDCSIIMKKMIINLTNFTSVLMDKNDTQVLNEHTSKIVISFFKLYIDYESDRVQIPCNFDNKLKYYEQEHYLCYRWCLYSTTEQIYKNSSTSKIVKSKNKYQQFYDQIVSYIEQMTQENASLQTYDDQNKMQMREKTDNRKYSNRVWRIYSFIACLMYPFSINGTNDSIFTNEFKLLILIKFNQIFLFLLTKVNLQDNFKEQQIKPIIVWICNLGLFCDQAKKKYKLQALLKNILELQLISCKQELDFNTYQSILYRILISIQKYLPRYPLKYYDNFYIQKPGIFHLYFFDQVLKQRQSWEACRFLTQLIQRWSNVDIRDFNLLGYVCKFILHNLNTSLKNFNQDKKQVTLSFFRNLSTEALIRLNLIFYQASFSDMISPLYNQQQTNALTISHKDTQQAQIIQHKQQSAYQSLPPILSRSYPPISLSGIQQQSSIISCGFSCCDRTIFLDKNFYIGEELLQWSRLLRDINQDDYYYHCRYFYFIIASAFKSEIPSIQKQLSKQKSTIDKTHNNNYIRAQQILQYWEKSINQNKVSYIQSIFQLFSCWSGMITSENLCSDQTNKFFFGYQHVRQIIRILFQNQDKFLNLPSIFTKNWQWYFKQMQGNTQTFDNFKKQQIKIKNRQMYFLRSIVKFFQFFAPKLSSLTPKSIPFQELVVTIQNYAQYGGGLVFWRSIRILSQKMSKNMFIQLALTVIRHSNNSSIGKLARKKLELYRQIVFALIEQSEICKKDQLPSEDSQQSNSMKFKSIEQLSQLDLRLKINQIIQQCIQLMCQQIDFVNKNQKNGNSLKSQKQELCNKFLALQIVRELLRKSQTDKKIQKIMINYFRKRKTQKNQNTMQMIRDALMKILFRDPKLVTRYERKLIMHLRSFCLNWVACNSSVQHLNGLLDIQQVYFVIWHSVLDQEIQLRIQSISIITNCFKQYQFSIVQSQLSYVVSILTLITTLQPKPKLRAYAQAMISRIYKMVYQATSGEVYSFVLKVALTIGFFLFNSKISLPCYDIFQVMYSSWLKNNKDSQYLIMSALQQVNHRKAKFRKININQSKDLGKDLKHYYFNTKNKKGWINLTTNNENPQLQQKSAIILRHLQCVISEKHKNIKFLKSRRQAIFQIQGFVEQKILQYGNTNTIANN